MQAKFLLPLLLFIALAIFLGIGLTLDPRHLPSTRIGKPAPAFELALLGRVDEHLQPSDLLGEPWLLNVWASWCVACRAEHPLLNDLAANTSITLVGLNYKDETDAAQQWLAERGNPYHYVPFDVSGDAGIEWGVYAVPETFVIDAQGTVVYKHIGPLNARVVNDEILPFFADKVLKNKSVRNDI